MAEGTGILQRPLEIGESSAFPSTDPRTVPSSKPEGCSLSILSPDEKRALARYEALIARGWQTFIEVGRALTEIRDQRLYRGQHTTFEAYCRERWQFRKSHVYRLIGAAEVVAYLSPIGDIPKPIHESQVRPLLGLKPEEARQAWEAACKTANGHTVTARLVKAAAARFRRGAEPPRPREGKTGKEENWQIWKSITELRRGIDARADHDVLSAQAADLEAQIESFLIRRKRAPATNHSDSSFIPGGGHFIKGPGKQVTRSDGSSDYAEPAMAEPSGRTRACFFFVLSSLLQQIEAAQRCLKNHDRRGELELLKKIHENIEITLEGTRKCQPAQLAARVLTKSEMKIGLLIREGMSDKEIASKLGVASATVQTHVAHMREKLHAHNRVRLSLMLWGIEQA